MQKRLRTTFIVALALVLTPMLAGCGGRLQAKKLGLREPLYQVRVERNLMIPMRDGVRMATDIFFPKGLAKAPTILSRTPYSKGVPMGFGRISLSEILAQRGYIVIVQDVRGRFKSEGDFYPFVNDGQDGQDMIAWIQAQPWSNGRIGTYGASYLGTTQWFAAPGQDLEAMALAVTSPNLKEVIYTNGELHLMTVFFWGTMMGERKMDLTMAPKLLHIDKYIKTLPLDRADDRMGRDVEYFNQVLDIQTIMKVYEGVNFEDRYKEVQAPAVFLAGWYDMFLGPQLRDFGRLRAEGRGNAKESALIVGPWAHGASGQIDYGPDSGMDRVAGPAQTIAWFDRWLQDADNEVKNWPRVKIFVMGDNVWRDENEWPLARTVYTNYYLHSSGKANTRAGDGVLSLAVPPAGQTPDRFDYDPMNPVPTRGGNNLGLNLHAHDQAKLEDRSDVLCYTSEPLTADLEVTGPISAVLFAASDAADTDFTVKLVDVYPDGKAINIQDGVVRAMYRRNDPNRPTPLVPGAIEEYQLDLWATSNVFKAGHRLRVEVSSSNFPRFNRNLNTGEPVTGATRAVVAHQTIVHDPEHPSHLVLPVIPR